MMKSGVALSLVVMLASSGGSLAADVLTDAPHDWSGFYLGIDAGWAWNGDTASGTFDWTPSNIEGASLGTNGGGGGTLSAGVLAGYNVQTDNLIAGLEADINYLGYDQSAETIIADWNSQLSASADWYGTLRGRLGFAGDRVMVYGTGGLAFGQAELSGRVVDKFDGSSVAAGSTSKLRVGWAAGAGIELAIDERWSAGAEYLHVDLGSLDLNYQDVAPGFSGTSSGDFAFDLVRATLRYDLR